MRGTMSPSHYDPQRHHRHSIRLPGYDYSRAGAYFVTICTHEKECLFGKITDGDMDLNEFGKIVWKFWQQIPARYENVDIPVAVVMPNHFHGIILFHETAGGGKVTTEQLNDPAFRRRMLLPKIMGYFKMNCAKEINELRNSSGIPVWQKNYYEHIIRDEMDYERKYNYIKNNPLKWLEDEEYSQQ